MKIAVYPGSFDPITFGHLEGRLHLTLQTTLNGRKVGLCEAGAG